MMLEFLFRNDKCKVSVGKCIIPGNFPSRGKLFALQPKDSSSTCALLVHYTIGYPFFHVNAKKWNFYCLRHWYLDGIFQHLALIILAKYHHHSQVLSIQYLKST
jgi:hypothetical protein